jgi:Uncharacterized protein/domain associated with GTPases
MRAGANSHTSRRVRRMSPRCASGCWRSPPARARRCRRSTPACTPAGSPTRSARASRRPGRRSRRKLIHNYCIAKGVAVALNPIPVADLLAAAGLDAAMVVQLSRVYGLPLTRAESGRLVAVISAQLAALMGAIWGMQLVASALKGVSAGLSVVVTAAAQGALGWYATVLIGRAAERYLIAGKSWAKPAPSARSPTLSPASTVTRSCARRARKSCAGSRAATPRAERILLIFFRATATQAWRLRLESACPSQSFRDRHVRRIRSPRCA